MFDHYLWDLNIKSFSFQKISAYSKKNNQYGETIVNGNSWKNWECFLSQREFSGSILLSKNMRTFMWKRNENRSLWSQWRSESMYESYRTKNWFGIILSSKLAKDRRKCFKRSELKVTKDIQVQAGFVSDVVQRIQRSDVWFYKVFFEVFLNFCDANIKLHHRSILRNNKLFYNVYY